MAVPKSLPKAELIGTFLETFAFGESFLFIHLACSQRKTGIYLVLFFETLLVLRRRYLQEKPMAYLLFVSLLVFVCIVQVSA
jgi:hypothetical protein